MVQRTDQDHATDLAEAFRRDGVVVARGVLGPAQLQRLADAVDRNLAEPGPWASDYTPEGFKAAFSRDFEILEEAPIEDSGRVLFRMERRA